MNISLRIFLLTAILSVSISYMRADDMSDLIAAVAGSVERMQADTRRALVDTLPRYTPKESSLDLDMLDGIYNAMTFQSSLNYILNAYDYHVQAYLEHEPEFEYWSGRPTLARSDFYRPVPGIITSRFGWRSKFNRMHHGVDLRLNIGDTVRAAVTGIVKTIGYDNGGYGNYVVMKHDDGMETVYGHLSYALVSQGQTVDMGYPIAIGGNTGNSTGPHMHFETKLGGVAVDPTLIFDFYGRYRYARKADASDNNASTRYSKSLSGKRTYVVRQGDTAKSVARRAGISVSRLCKLNMIKESDPLKIGRMLKLR